MASAARPNNITKVSEMKPRVEAGAQDRIAISDYLADLL